MDGDEVVFENSVKNNEDPVLFTEKKYTFITDATSNQGSFSGGQIQFALDTFNSQSQWINLTEAVVEFPIKCTVQVTGAAAATATNGFADINSIIMKNGFHQWFNGAQLIVNGQTIQSNQSYENVAATYRILSSWSQDNLVKWGPTCGIALDDMTCSFSGQTTAGVDKLGLNNAAYNIVCTTAKGFDCVNNQGVLGNTGVITRAKLNNTTMNTTSVAGTILGVSQITNAGISNVVGTASTAAGSNTVGTYLYTQFMMGTVRVRDLFDISEFPLVKNIRGFMYLSYNSFSCVLNGSVSSGTTLSSFTSSPLNGLSCPFLINDSAGGITYPLTTAGSGAGQLTVVGKVDGTSTGALGSSAPLLTQARMLAPFYVATPRVDAALTKTQRFSTYEKIVNPIICAAGQTINYTVTVGVPNPRKLVLLPMWQSLGSCTSTATPEFSPWDSVPSTSGPFAVLNQLQVYVANKPLFQYPISYDFEQWNANISQLGANGNIISELTSGLLTQQQWQQNQRFYAIDLERRNESEDGASKSVQVSFTNPSATIGMKVIAIVFYEKRWEIVTDICKLSSYA